MDKIYNPLSVPELSSPPSAPSSGYQKIYAKTDGKLYVKDSSDTETELTNVAGSGIGTLNTLTGATQTFAVGSSGTDFNISSAGSTHTFNIPNAAGLSSIRGLVTNNVQSFGGRKTFLDNINLGDAAYGTGLIKFIGAAIGEVSLTVNDAAGTWTLTLPQGPGTNGQVLTTNGSGVTSWTSASGGISEAKALMISSLRI